MQSQYFTTSGLSTTSSKSTNNATFTGTVDNLGSVGKTINEMQINISNLLTTVNGIPAINVKIAQMLSRIVELEAAKVSIINYHDNDMIFGNVYNTAYMNSVLESVIPKIYADLDMKEVVMTNPYNIFSSECILSIPNIRSIPTVYTDTTLSMIDSNPKLLNASTCIEMFDKIVQPKSTFCIDETAPFSTYTCAYVNNLAIPTMIYDENETSPLNSSTYSSTYLNGVINSVANVYDDRLKQRKVNSLPNVYSCTYIDSIAIPNAILNLTDEHISKKIIEDDTIYNVYNTYYMDQFVDVIKGLTFSDMVFYSSSLKVKFYPKSQRKNVLVPGSDTKYRQKFGALSQEYIFTSTNNDLVLYWNRGDYDKVINKDTSNIVEFAHNEFVEPYGYVFDEKNKIDYGGMISSNRVLLSDASKYLFNVYNNTIIDSNSSVDNGLVPDDKVPNSAHADYKFIKNSKLQLLTLLDNAYKNENNEYIESSIFGFYKYNSPLTYMYKKIVKTIDETNSSIKVNVGFNGDTTNQDRWTTIEDSDSVFGFTNDKINLYRETNIYENVNLGYNDGSHTLNTYGHVKMNCNENNDTSYGFNLTRTNNSSTNYNLASFVGKNMNISNTSNIIIGNENSNDNTLDGVTIKYIKNNKYTISTNDDEFKYADNLYTFNKDVNMLSNLIVDKNVTVKGVVTQTSDQRLKSNIQPLNNDIISKLKPSSYTLNSDPSTLHYGFIAQDVQTVAPELVSQNNEYLSVNYIDIIAQLVHHVQQQDLIIRDLKTKIDVLMKT